jgi:hypothetical protein
MTDARITLRLLDDSGRTVSDQGEEGRIQMALGALRRRRLSVVVETEGIDEGRVGAIEAILYTRTDRERAVGSLGIVLTGNIREDE